MAKFGWSPLEECQQLRIAPKKIRRRRRNLFAYIRPSVCSVYLKSMISNRKTNISVKNGNDNAIMLSSAAQTSINVFAPYLCICMTCTKNGTNIAAARARLCDCRLKKLVGSVWHGNVAGSFFSYSFFSSRPITFTYCNADRTLSVPLYSFVIWHSFTRKKFALSSL